MDLTETLTNEEMIAELLGLLKQNAMYKQSNDVFEMCCYVDSLEKKIDAMTEEITNMQKQIKEMQEDTLVNNAKKALYETQEKFKVKCDELKTKVFEIKQQVTFTAKSIVEEAKVKGREALNRVAEFTGIKKKLLNIRKSVRNGIDTVDKDIAKISLLTKGLREASQSAANSFREFADKPEKDYRQKEQKHLVTKMLIAPLKSVRKIYVSIEMHLDASIDKLDDLSMNVQLDKEKNAKYANDDIQEKEKSYELKIAEPQKYQYNAEAFEAKCREDIGKEIAIAEVPVVREEKAR